MTAISQEQAPCSTTRRLPEYAAEMADFHAAFHSELGELLDQVAIRPDAQVLDVACGDGFYSRLIARRLGSAGRVIGLDINLPFLELAEENGCANGRVTFVQGKLEEYPAKEKFDVVWCAQSLYSLAEPATAISQMLHFVKPGGTLAILENDTLHQLLLPWPAALELAVRTAEFAAIAKETPHAEKYYVGRHLNELLADAGLVNCEMATQCVDRRAPLSPALQRFLTAHLKRLRERVTPLMTPKLVEILARTISPESPNYLLNQPQFAMSWLNRVAWGRKPVSIISS